ncbi:MAG: hypothetical protein AUJ52_05815 [Elusimicrobia bacterium CG1_02_63_36]|nr:MAG: hypothetical protein AUJ52_05815 [Elusimicrobia bacterium CG1_02_63_36]
MNVWLIGAIWRLKPARKRPLGVRVLAAILVFESFHHCGARLQVLPEKYPPISPSDISVRASF